MGEKKRSGMDGKRMVRWITCLASCAVAGGGCYASHATDADGPGSDAPSDVAVDAREAADEVWADAEREDGATDAPVGDADTSVTPGVAWPFSGAQGIVWVAAMSSSDTGTQTQVRAWLRFEEWAAPTALASSESCSLVDGSIGFADGSLDAGDILVDGLRGDPVALYHDGSAYPPRGKDFDAILAGAAVSAEAAGGLDLPGFSVSAPGPAGLDRARVRPTATEWPAVFRPGEPLRLEWFSQDERATVLVLVYLPAADDSIACSFPDSGTATIPAAATAWAAGSEVGTFSLLRITRGDGRAGTLHVTLFVVRGMSRGGR